MASSSSPKDLICSGVSSGIVVVCIAGLLLLSIEACGALAPLEIELDVTDGDTDADLDVLFACARGLATEEVANGARRLAAGAGMADAHPAAELGAESGLLGLLQ